MIKYKHISLDVWNTLIKPNKKFSAARNQMIADLTGLRTDVISEQYGETKVYLDSLARNYGLGCSTLQAIQLLLTRLSKFHDNAANEWDSARIGTDIYRNIDCLFNTYAPVVDPNVIKAITDLRESGISMNISSNSNFVCGDVMQPFLRETFGLNTFRYFLFSDQLGVAKPSFQFFQKIKVSWPLLKSEVLHVGDDDLYDKKSEDVGIRFARIDERHTIPWLTAKILKNEY